ncbi:MAG: hypothetical protein AAFO29_26630, partial [Actinomycetota bacterium]
MSNDKHALRFLFPALVALALIAGACGGDDDTEAEASASASEPTDSASGSASGSASASASASASEPAEDDGDAEDTEDAADDGGAEDDEGAGATVTVTDVIGEKDVPVTADGIYALDEFMGTLLLTLGVEPVTTAAFFEDPLLAPVIEPRSELVTAGGVESVAVTRPNLILGIGHPNLIEIEPELSGVAPVVLPDFTTDWKDQTRLTAQVVGREAEGDAVIAAVEARTAALAAEIEEAGLAGSGAA